MLHAMPVHGHSGAPQLWYALAWCRAYNYARVPAFLETAQAIFKTLLEDYHAWNGTCGGGVKWSVNNPYINAITNELFLATATRLHILTGGSKVLVAGYTYLEVSVLIRTTRASVHNPRSGVRRAACSGPSASGRGS
jgi:hypothetical protein